MWAKGGHRPDKFFLAITAALVGIGLIVFSSASFGLLARGGAGLENVFFSQLVLGLLGGLIIGYFAYRIDLNKARPYAFGLFVLSVLATFLVFIPGLGLEWAGAKRWLDLGPLSFQPAELLKVIVVFFLASWMATSGKDIKTLKYGLFPFMGIVALTVLPLILQPDNATTVIIFATAFSMFLIAGGQIKHMLILGLVGILLFTALAIARPYVMQRVTSFLNLTEDPLGADYQVRQSLLAVGSGQITGRGWGQSLQKFQYLPEPVGDSIFAVYSEEFGFIGSSLMIILFVLFSLRGLRIAARAPNTFTKLLATGLIMMIISQVFLNIGAMIGGTFGMGVHRLFPDVTAQPGAYATVGIGSFLAAATHAPLTAIFLLFEMTGNYEIIVPIMLAAIIGVTTARGIYQDSIDTVELSRKGLNLHGGREAAIVSSIRVRQVMDTEFHTVHESANLTEVIRLLLDGNSFYLPVVDDQKNIMGVISLQDLKSVLYEETICTIVRAGQLATEDPVTITADDNLGTALHLMALKDLGQLPVVSAEGGRKVVGMLRRGHVMATYEREVLRRASHS